MVRFALGDSNCRSFFWIGLLLSACGVTSDGEGGKILYLGTSTEADRFSAPLETDVVSRETETFGLWLELSPNDTVNGIGLRYRHRELMVTPIDCRIVFRIENEAQLQQAVNMNRDLMMGDEELCIVQD